MSQHANVTSAVPYYDVLCTCALEQYKLKLLSRGCGGHAMHGSLCGCWHASGAQWGGWVRTLWDRKTTVCTWVLHWWLIDGLSAEIVTWLVAHCYAHVMCCVVNVLNWSQNMLPVMIACDSWHVFQHAPLTRDHILGTSGGRIVQSNRAPLPPTRSGASLTILDQAIFADVFWSGDWSWSAQRLTDGHVPRASRHWSVGGLERLVTRRWVGSWRPDQPLRMAHLERDHRWCMLSFSPPPCKEPEKEPANITCHYMNKY